VGCDDKGLSFRQCSEGRRGDKFDCSEVRAWLWIDMIETGAM